MQRSPCYECSVHLAGQDKNGQRCLDCDKRTAYVAALGGRSAPMPMEMTDMAGHSPEKTRSDDQFIRENQDMPVAKIAEQLGRSPAAIHVRRSKLGLTKNKRREMIKERAELLDVEKSKKEEPPEPAPAALKANTAPLSDLLWDLVNVREFEDLYERLKRSAKENFRTPDLQALWFINRGLAAEDGACDQRRHSDGSP